MARRGHENLQARTKQFALRVIRLVTALPRNPITDIIGRQLARAGMSVGANYRSASRAKSTKDFVAKMALVEEEADESHYWMELLVDDGHMRKELVADLMREAGELTAIAVASVQTARGYGRK